MTKDNPVAAGMAECVAARKAIYELKRDACNAFAEDEFTQFEVYAHTVEAFEYLEADLRAIAASPVQAGIDPLVARLENWGAPQKGSAKPLMREAAKAIRSQAERIAALDGELDAFKACHVIGRPQDGYREMVWREAAAHYEELALSDRNAAESRLAEAREALERRPKLYCAMLTTGVCDQVARLEDAIQEGERYERLYRNYEERAETAEAEIARLEAEREAHLTELGRVIMACPPGMRGVPASAGVRKLRDAKEAAESRLAEAREALEPFAQDADAWDGFDETEPLVEGWPGGPSDTLKVFHLRRARATLSRLKPGEKGGE